jgi:hypothetical protein
MGYKKKIDRFANLMWRIFKKKEPGQEY